MQSINFETARSTRTEYLIGEGAAQELRRKAGTPVVAIVDEKLFELQPERVAGALDACGCSAVFPLKAGEASKGFPTLISVLDFMTKHALPKHGTLIAIGGGTVLDVAAMAASLMRRGTPLILVPTTLLAQIDAAVGGKNGINFGGHKNLVGGFHHAEMVVADTGFLTTLADRERICGLAEAVKVLLVADADAYRRHFAGPGTSPDLAGLVRDAVRCKLDLLADDPFENSSRRLLNYGHAFAHFFEEESCFSLMHGEAVLLGIIVENEVSRLLGLGEDEVIDQLQSIVTSLLTDDCRRHWLPFEAIGGKLDHLRQMRRGCLNLVCMHGPGCATIVDEVPDELLSSAWRRSSALIGTPPADSSKCQARMQFAFADNESSPAEGHQLPFIRD